MPPIPAYIIAARRSAIGRVGGLHKSRRIEELSAPVLGAALHDSGLKPAQVDEVIVGNVTQGGNPARLIALAAGLPETVSASTIDRQCGSGLDAIVSADAHDRHGRRRGNPRRRRRGDLHRALADREAEEPASAAALPEL